MFDLANFSTPAVIPSAIGPLQALIAILPHLMVVLGTVLVAFFKPKTYRALFRYCWAHKGLTTLVAAPVVLFFFRGALFGAKVVDEKGGAAWTAFRGGPERTGALAGARGPFENPLKIWSEPKTSTGTVQEINASPTVVGNRVYFGTNVQTVKDPYGSIFCLDADTGATAWTFSGKGMDRPLQPIFSSPALGGGSADAGKSPAGEARYLVCGEGYHKNDDSRIFCIDLAPVRASGKPEFKWSIPTTNHVECSPCIFENKVYCGSGDDGWWCIDLESGKVKWHLDGCEYYVIKAGAQADALAKLNGKIVAVEGTPTRFRPHRDSEGKEYDISFMFLDAGAFTEVPAGTTLVSNFAQSVTGKDMRTVIGKVVVTDAVNNPEQNGSRVKIEPEKFYPDAECCPVALRIDGQPRLICGAGEDGQAVLCIDAENGKEIWRTHTHDPVFAAPTVVNGMIIAGESNGTFAGSAPNPSGSVLALSAVDGHVLWEFKTADGVLGAVAVRDRKAYSTCRDGSLYVLDIREGTPKDGKLIKKCDMGTAISCSPAVTDCGVYFGTESGKLYCLNRESLTFQWSLNLTPKKGIVVSSPCAAGDRLYIGSANGSGVICLNGEPATGPAHKIVKPWSGPGGNAARDNSADDRGTPDVSGNKAERTAVESKLMSAAIAGPMAACGNALYFSARNADGKNVLACIDSLTRRDAWQYEIGGTLRAIAATETLVSALFDANGGIVFALIDSTTGKRTAPERYFPADEQPFLCLTSDGLIAKSSRKDLLGINLKNPNAEWQADVGEMVGAPALKHGLIFLAIAAPKPQLVCLDDSSRVKLWFADLAAKPIGGPSIFGDKVFVATERKGGDGATIVCRRLTDGGAVWESDVEKAPVSPLALSGEHLAFTAGDGSVLVLETLKGEQTHTVPLGKGGQAAAIIEQTLFLGADNRIGAYDLATSTWLWGFRDQKTAGRVWTAPILANETVWICTEKQGLIGIGGKER